MAKTKLTGFMKGAKQIVSFLKGELITEKQFNSIQDKMIKKYAGVDSTHPQWNELVAISAEVTLRRQVGQNYVAFKNYAEQMQKLTSRKEKGMTTGELHQLAADNRAVRNLNLHGGTFFKYGSESSDAMQKYKNIIMDNDFRKLQYLDSLPEKAVNNVDIKNINNISLPPSESANEQDYNQLKERMEELSERLRKLDDNRHVNSLEFRKMKSAVNSLTKSLEKPWKDLSEDEQRIVGEKLEALQQTSMNYVQAKGVGRQSSQMGKDRMDLGLDLAEVSADFMNIFASQKRLDAVKEFEDSLDIECTKNGVFKGFLNGDAGADKTSAKIFQDEERGIDQYGNRTRIVPDKPAIEDPEDELSDDDESYLNEY